MFLASLLLAAAVSFGPDDAALAYATTEEFVRDCTPRDAGTLRGRLAADWLLDRVSRTGVDASIDSFRATVPDGEASFRNVVVELVSEKADAPWIVLLSHYDTAPHVGEGFQGANDGASTSGLLVSLVGAIRRAGKPKYNIACIWTDAEECRVAYTENDGFQGAKRAVAFFKENKRRIGAVIGLDMLGDANLAITLPDNGTPRLKEAVHRAAKRAGCESLVKNGDMLVKDDFAVFLDAGCPAVNLIDFEYGSAPGKNDYWHSTQDRMDKISEKSLLTSGRLVAELLNVLQGAD